MDAWPLLSCLTQINIYFIFETLPKLPGYLLVTWYSSYSLFLGLLVIKNLFSASDIDQTITFFDAVGDLCLLLFFLF